MKKISSKMFLISKILGLSVISLTGVMASINKNFFTNENKNYLLEIGENNSSNETNSFSKIAPLDWYGETPILTQKMGPIVSYGSSISALNWYGQTVWSFDLSKNKQHMPGNLPQNSTNKWVPFVNRAFVNWSLDTERNILWLLTNTYYKNPSETNDNGETTGPQKVIGIDSINGKILYEYNIENNAPKGFDIFYQLQVLKNGNVLVYSNGRAENWWKNIIIDAQTGQKTTITTQTNKQRELYDSVKKELDNFKSQNGHNHFRQTQTKMLYLISIATNVNVAIFCDFSPDILTTSDQGSGDLLLKLVDDNFEPIEITNDSSPWKKGIYIKNLLSVEDAKKLNDLNKGSNDFNKSFYKTIDGNIYYGAWEKFFVFSSEFEKGYGIRVKELKFENKQVQSFTMDVNGNVFMKFKNDPYIIKLIINGTKVEDIIFDQIPYFNLSDSSDEFVRQNANNFFIFNVWGETGSLMMINCKSIIGGKNISEYNKDQDESKQYGLAVGIVPNSLNPSTGDTKGLLNGVNTIQKAADFEVNSESLKSKLPSEITRNDLLITNDGFLTKNSEKNSDGSLKYPAFNLKDIDDSKGYFTVEAYLDKIPWFSNRLPANSIPTKIVKTYNTDGKKAEIISNKTSWKTQDLLSYDFKNSTPNQITLDDIYKFDPFQVSFSSKVILDSQGNQSYPKKTYEIIKRDDKNGEINIQVKYEYFALSDDINQKLEYSTTQKFNVFKSDDKREFHFAGETSNVSNNVIDINNVPQLKKLAQSNVLPSSFVKDNLSIDDYLSFIDTEKSKGYPISKMDISFIANDNNGELTITAKSTFSGETFSQTYTGLNKKVDYYFNFIDNLRFDKRDKLPSSINEGDIMNGFIDYSGFNSSDFNINLYPNNDKGTLGVEVVLNNNFPNDLANQHGFIDYKIYKQYDGFMTTDMFNKQYSIIMKEDGDESLKEVKKLTTQAIIKGLNDGMLITNGKVYTSKELFVKEVFVKNIGSKIPIEWEKYKDNEINITLTNNNEAGTMNVLISIKKEIIKGANSDLNIVKSYSGFVKGNKTQTADNLAFISQELISTIPEIKGRDAKFVERWLYNDPETKLDVNITNLKKLLLTYTGGYINGISEKKFKLITKINEIYNTISITIIFDDSVSLENGSLREYSVQYQF